MRLADLGLVRPLEGGGDLTATAMAVGTPGYMSPEQIRGLDPTPGADALQPWRDAFSPARRPDAVRRELEFRGGGQTPARLAPRRALASVRLPRVARALRRTPDREVLAGPLARCRMRPRRVAAQAGARVAALLAARGAGGGRGAGAGRPRRRLGQCPSRRAGRSPGHARPTRRRRCAPPRALAAPCAWRIAGRRRRRLPRRGFAPGGGQQRPCRAGPTGRDRGHRRVRDEWARARWLPRSAAPTW